MHGNNHEKDLNTLNAGIAKSREEIAVLVAGLKKLADRKIDDVSTDDERPREGPVNGERLRSAWNGFRDNVVEAGARGERVAQGFAVEIERHPLVGGLAAFGLGFVIAKLLFKSARTNPRT